MQSPWIAAAFAVFAWWFFTGLILLVVRRADAGDAVAHGRNVFLSIPVFALGAAGLVVSADSLTVQNVYISFVSVLLIWGWIELAFLSGVITVRAWHTVSHHEILLLGTFLVILSLATHAENTFGFWTYLILFVAAVQTAPLTVGFALLTALAALAAIEHWLMVVPLPDAKLWRWMLPDAPTTNKDRSHEF